MDARSILRAQDASRQNLTERDARRRAVLTNTYTGALTTTTLRVNGLADQKPVIDVGWTLPAESLNPRVDFWSNANLIASKMKAVIRSQVTGIDTRGPTPTAAASALIAAEARTHEPVFAMKPQILNGRSTSGALGLPSAKTAILALANPNIPETLPFLQSIVDRLIAKYQAVLNSSSSVRHASREMEALAVQLGCSRNVALLASRAINRSYFPGQDMESKEQAEEERLRKLAETRTQVDSEQKALDDFAYAEAEATAAAAKTTPAEEAAQQKLFDEGEERQANSDGSVLRYWQNATREAWNDSVIGVTREWVPAKGLMYAYYMLHDDDRDVPFDTVMKDLLGYVDEPATNNGEGHAKRVAENAKKTAFIEEVTNLVKTEVRNMRRNYSEALKRPNEDASAEEMAYYVFMKNKPSITELDKTSAMLEDIPWVSADAVAPDVPMAEDTMAEDNAAATNPLMAKKPTQPATDTVKRVAPKQAAQDDSAARRKDNREAAKREVARIRAAKKAETARASNDNMDVVGPAVASANDAMEDDDEFEDAMDGEGAGRKRKVKSTTRRKVRARGGASDQAASTTDADVQPTAPVAAAATPAVGAKKETAETSSNTDVASVAAVIPATLETVATIATPVAAEPAVPPTDDPAAGKVPSTGQAPVVQKKKVQSKLPQGTVTTVPRVSRDMYTPGTDLPRPLVPPTQWTAVQKAKAPKTELERRLA